jgi:hypothetical protein
MLLVLLVLEGPLPRWLLSCEDFSVSVWAGGMPRNSGLIEVVMILLRFVSNYSLYLMIPKAQNCKIFGSGQE